ncbi:hypothetical protein A1O3_09318 [Capronia epimyces CBS 606.96]|uniref:NB-ARC domain-containing protein n=1 Tax=Capronia epimyces CBS 606.96 TaxID=1182542 RepID=W9XCD8_9EURO|nr:uncharacterized protein A1O3_09318 [Capronia epimyces CBS 606.96]EXJ78157.1 hypothetical protein A1O3_09318 [Capronia epimyces CBS 606.96]
MSFDPIWYVPPVRRANFGGRAEELAELEQKLFEPDGRRTVPILGLGGVGKSRLALELAYQVKSNHPEHSIFWIQASDEWSFARDWLKIGQKLGIPGFGDDEADVKPLVQQRLNNSEDKWLLILDNADDEWLWGRGLPQELLLAGSGVWPRTPNRPLVSFLPRTMNGSVLVTTRSRQVATFIAEEEVVELRAPPQDEAIDIFIKRLDRLDAALDQKTLVSLLIKLAFLPLAIVQAASFINMVPHMTVQTYMKLLDAHDTDVVDLLSEDFGDSSRYPDHINPIATTRLVSFDHIRTHHTLAADLLSSMACVHEMGIPLSLFTDDGTKLEAIKAVGVLMGYSFVTKQTETISNKGELYDVHRLVLLAARNWLKMEGTLSDRITACTIRLADIFPQRCYKNKGIWTIYMPHAHCFYRPYDGKELPERYKLLEKTGQCFLADGKYDLAIRTHISVVNYREQTLGPLNQETYSAYDSLGEALYRKGRWRAAEDFSQKAFYGNKEVLGAEHPDTMTSMTRLGSTYRSQGRLTQAEELEVQVVETRKRVLGPEHPDTLTSMANLASTYRSQGRLTQAEELLIQVVDTWKRVLSIEHPDTLISMEHLALMYYNQGRWTQTEELVVQVTETRKRVLGAEHSDTLTSMANLASTYKAQGRDDEAMALMTFCVELRSKVLGTAHPDTQAAVNLLQTWRAVEEIVN